MKAGLTASSKPLKLEQITKFRYLMDLYRFGIGPGFEEFHHGSCINGDYTCYVIVRDMITPEGWGRIQIITHLGDNPAKTAPCELGALVIGRKPNLERNIDIIKASDIIFALPQGFDEVRRSGEWHVIRHTIKAKKWLQVIWPNGETNLYIPGHRFTPTYGVKKVMGGDEVVCGRCGGKGQLPNHNVVEPKTDACGMCGGRGYVVVTVSGRVKKIEDLPVHYFPVEK